MIAELLTFNLPPPRRDEWVAADERIWTQFLEGQQGFINKQVWIPDDCDQTVLVVVWWESRKDWQRITQEQIAHVDKLMGDLYIKPELKIMTVCATPSC